MTIVQMGQQSDHPFDQVSAAAPVSEFGLTKFLDPLRIPPVIKAGGDPLQRPLKIAMKEADVQLHSELPATRMWTYEGHFPGPTIEVRRGQKLRVAWRNAVSGSFPMTAVDVPVGPGGLTEGPGRDGELPRPEVAALPPWLVVHVHGAHTGAGNDGWTENAVLPGETQLAEYLNHQQATTLWYHDHAMAITALNVMTGLAGMYLIRDAEEDALHLPSGKHEVPLVICDRNLDADEDDQLTGDLLYKTGLASRPNVPDMRLPFTGPYNVVNGVIWPHMKVDARWYRFRMLNASNARPYTFQLQDDTGAPVHGALVQIGSDGGLLPVPVALDGLAGNPRPLTLNPGERADVLIDFSKFRGKTLTLANVFPPPLPPATFSPNRDVMQFRVRPNKVRDDFTLPATLSPSFVRLTHDSPHSAHRWVALVTLDNRADPEMWEMEELTEPPASMPADGIIQVQVPNEGLVTLQRVTRIFEDPVAFTVKHHAWEQWRFLNLSVFPHPMHIHLATFQALAREIVPVISRGAFSTALGGTTAPVTLEPGGLAPGEQGWKDVIQVAPFQMVSVIGQFTGGTGRFVHHCHIFEHEDMGMMRTFVVMPEEVLAHMPHHGGGHDHA